MDKDTVTYLLVAALVATAILIALAVAVPRFTRRGGRSLAAASAGSASVAFDTADRGYTAMTLHETVPAPVRARAADSNTGDDPGLAGTDPATGMLTPTGWGRVIADEDARVRRYRRAATIVMIELDGLDRLTSRLGEAAGERLIPAVAETVKRLAREADHVARLDRGRFGVLLPETDEIQAIHYVERVRRTCDLWLESGAVTLRLAIGWASATGDDSLHEAGRAATERMFGEMHQNALRAAEVPAPISADVSNGATARRAEV